MPEKQDPVAEQMAALRREQILDAATTVFAAKGFHRATIKDIARTAGIADGTIYLYFTNKTQLLLSLLDRLNETELRAAQLAAGSGRDIRSFFAEYVRQRLMLLWPNAQLFRAVLPELFVNAELREMYYGHVVAPTIALAERLFAAEMAAGRMRLLDAPLTVRTIAGSVLGLLTMHLLGDTEIARRWEELPDVLTSLLFDGLRPDASAPSTSDERPMGD